MEDDYDRRHANFSGANLGRNNLGGRSSIKGTDLTDANLEGANLADAVFDDATKFPTGFNPRERGLVHKNELLMGDSREG